jgi:hypothetical protein
MPYQPTSAQNLTLLSYRASRLVPELKKNCPSELIIYIVGSKSDLHQYRQVTSDLARLSLHTWFPPPKPPSPPPPPPPSTLSYIRPRFTSFTSIRSTPTPPPGTKSSPESPSNVDAPISALKRSHTTSSAARLQKKAGCSAVRSNSSGAIARSPQPQSRFTSNLGLRANGWNELGESSSNSLNEDEEDAAGERGEWGLHDGMELFEVSAKDATGKWLCVYAELAKRLTSR